MTFIKKFKKIRNRFYRFYIISYDYGEMQELKEFLKLIGISIYVKTIKKKLWNGKSYYDFERYIIYRKAKSNTFVPKDYELHEVEI